MKALVLTGGAARGVYAAGVVEGLLASETFDIICGSSIGALNGLAIALDRSELLRELWSRIAQARILRLAPPLAALDTLRREALAVGRGSLGARARALARLARGLPELMRLGGVRQLLGVFEQQALRDILDPIADLRALRRDFIVSATNLTKSSTAAFYAFPADADGSRERAYRSAEPAAEPLTQANFVAALCASSALPGAFAPVPIALADGSVALFVDGGVANNSPIGQAIDAGATEVTIVLLQHSGLLYRDRTVRSLGDVGFFAHDIIQERILELELAYVRAINELVIHGIAAPDRRFIDLRVIGPSVPLRISALSFNDQASIDRVYNLGVADGRSAQSVGR